MKFVPRDYQGIGIDHVLEHDRSGLFVFMGAGKTVITLTAIDMLHMTGQLTKPVLVLAPKRVAQSTWPNEVAKWDHLSGMEIQPVIGTEQERLAALRNRNASVFTINYENIVWLLEKLNKKWPFAMCVADESTKLKGFRLRQGGKRAQQLGKVAHLCDYWLNLTGTPAPNGLIDLWGQTWFLDRGQRLGRTFESFKQRWFQPSFNGYDIDPLPHAQGEIESRLKDVCLSLKAEDYFDIQKPIETRVWVDLPSKAREMYDDMEAKMFMEVESVGVEAFNAAAKTMKCLQVANGAVYLDRDVTEDDSPKTKEWREVHDEKIQALESIINEWNGTPILVAYHFKPDLVRLKKAFPKGRVFDDKPQTERDWNAGKIPLMFAHPDSCGHGSNLQDGGFILVFFSINWSLESHEQIIERIGPVRQAQAGHNRAVYLYYIMARDTIDEVVKQRLESKASVQDSLREAMKKRSTK